MPGTGPPVAAVLGLMTIAAGPVGWPSACGGFFRRPGGDGPLKSRVVTVPRRGRRPAGSRAGGQRLRARGPIGAWWAWRPHRRRRIGTISDENALGKNKAAAQGSKKSLRYQLMGCQTTSGPMIAYALSMRMRPPLWLVVLVGLALAGSTFGVAITHEGRPSTLPPAGSAAMTTETPGLSPAMVPAKAELRTGAWADTHRGKLHLQLTLSVVVALLLCALVRFLMDGRTVRWRLQTALQPWAQRAPPLLQHT